MSCRQILGTFILLASSSFAVEAAENKSEFHLFNPTPEHLMREMSTDRPDKTESAYTVDAGHIQMETSFIDYTYNHHDPVDTLVRVDTFSFLPTNLKVGLLNNVDFQFVIDPYTHEVTRDDGVETKKDGFGDIQNRLKINLWGNDGGRTALAFMPFVKYPTNSDNLGNDTVESGFMFPLAVELPNDWGMGLMAEFDFNRNEADDDYHTEFIHTITFGHPIVGNLSGYVEFFSNISTEDNTDWLATVDGGLTYALNESVQLDIGMNIGVTENADDLNPFCGVSIRY